VTRRPVRHDKFEVKPGGTDLVDLGKDPETGKVLGKQQVPRTVEVWASRSKK
jgi:hypothetical protein